VRVEVLREVTDEMVGTFNRLLPQLSRGAPPLDRAVLQRLVSSDATTVLIAWADGQLAGTLSLVMFPVPTGLRAWIEDVIVDQAARGQGIGEALTMAALRLAEEAGARTVDLTSRPSREAAGRLYERVGFQARETRAYRYAFAAAAAARPAR
jgi:ribosomal protein S18 acetylase RimI-like enzyme